MGRQAAQLAPMAQTLRAGHPAYGADRTRNLRLIRRPVRPLVSMSNNLQYLKSIQDEKV